VVVEVKRLVLFVPLVGEAYAAMPKEAETSHPTALYILVPISKL